jgi:DNA replication protein DnaC
VTGPTGIGKTWLGCALAQRACRDGFTILHKRSAELFRDLAVAHIDGSFGRQLLKLSRIDILILDDFAMAPSKTPSGVISWSFVTTATSVGP